MTSLAAVQKEVEKLKEKTGVKKPRYIYVTLWHGLYMGDPENIVNREGEWITIRIECKT